MWEPLGWEQDCLRFGLATMMLSDPSQRKSNRTAGKRRLVNSMWELLAYGDRQVIEFLKCPTGIVGQPGTLASVEAARPYVEYALEHGAVAMLMKLKQDHGFDVHEFRWADDGRSALHYLIDSDRVKYLRNRWSINWILKGSGVSNRSDRHGFTYFHAACAAGKRELAKRLIDESALVVNVDSWKTSPLHLACQYRHKDLVKLLLARSANVNLQDREGAAPLHALARLCLCRCASHENFCDRRKPVRKIVKMLLKAGADLEAVDRHGDTPLRAAVASCDADLVRCLLDAGARLDSLNEDRLFRREFRELELKNYPLTWNILETVELLMSRGYEMSLKTRIRMIKYWVKIRGLDVDHLIPDLDKTRNILTYERFMQNLLVHMVHKFYLKQESMDHLREKRWELRRGVWGSHADRIESELNCQFLANMAFEAAQLKRIEVKEGLSLYGLCRMDHNEGSIEMKDRWSDWSCPELHKLDYTRLSVKRYLANCRIRPHLESCAADMIQHHLQRHNVYVTCSRFDASVSNEMMLGWCSNADENDSFVPETPRQRQEWKMFQIGWNDGKKKWDVQAVKSSENP